MIDPELEAAARLFVEHTEVDLEMDSITMTEEAGEPSAIDERAWVEALLLEVDELRRPSPVLDYVYVVTVSRRGASIGEFVGTPTAFEDQNAGEIIAFDCRQELGGRFWEAEEVGDGDHIVQRWDSDEFSVWLERLIFEGKQ